MECAFLYFFYTFFYVFELLNVLKSKYVFQAVFIWRYFATIGEVYAQIEATQADLDLD